MLIVNSHSLMQFLTFFPSLNTKLRNWNCQWMEKFRNSRSCYFFKPNTRVVDSDEECHKILVCSRMEHLIRNPSNPIFNFLVSSRSERRRTLFTIGEVKKIDAKRATAKRERSIHWGIFLYVFGILNFAQIWDFIVGRSSSWTFCCIIFLEL